MDVKLTKDSDKMLREIYASYLERRAAGVPKGAAKDFADETQWPEDYADSWKSPNAGESLAELKRAGMIKLFIIGGFKLTDDSIIYMENRFKNGLSEVLKTFGEIKSAIPFL